MEDPRLYMQVAATIEGRIASGIYEPGRRLNIGLLASEEGVSRRTVSTALNVLATRDLVEFFQGLGWFIAGE